MIDIDALQELPPGLTLAVGDVVRLGASRAKVVRGGEILEILGPLLPGVLVERGRLLSPEGVPAIVLVVARRSGQAQIALSAAFGGTDTVETTLQIDVSD